MDDYFLRLPQVLEITGIKSRTTLWEWRKAGKFPEPIRLCTKIVVWKKTEVLEWMSYKVKGLDWRTKCLKK
tara:strand:+ start:2713 stop:2925 length:213 start_codon:yes stop_codon:yes gene_type:complete